MIWYLIFTYAVLALILWVQSIRDIINTNFQSQPLKYTWLVIVILFPVVGAIVFFQLKKRLTGNPRVFKPDFENIEKNWINNMFDLIKILLVVALVLFLAGFIFGILFKIGLIALVVLAGIYLFQRVFGNWKFEFTYRSFYFSDWWSPLMKYSPMKRNWLMNNKLKI